MPESKLDVFKVYSDERLLRIFLSSGISSQGFRLAEITLNERGYSPAKILAKYDKFIRSLI